MDGDCAALRIVVGGREVLALAGTFELAGIEGRGDLELEFHVPVPVEQAAISHSGFVRIYGEATRPADRDWRFGNASPLTAPFHVAEDLGVAPFGLYPPLVVFAPEATWLFGPLTQSRARVVWNWRADGEGRLVVRARLVRATATDEIWDGEKFFVRTWDTRQALTAELFREYNDALAAHGCGRPPRSGLTWATWNDGVFRDIDEERILRQADFLAEHVPQAEWLDVDDGWAGPAATVPNEDGSLGMSDFAVFYRPDRLEGDSRFPRGLHGLADAIRARGLRPMLWMTPSVDFRSELFKDHPEWFQPDLRLHFVPEMRFLDLSVPEARDFVEAAFDLAFREWGYEGSKLDFWSMGFEQPDVQLRDPSRTPVEWEAWFLDQLRARLPEDGLLLHCIDLPFGTPFRSRWFDHFRMYADSEGSCAVPDMMREQALWTAFLVGLYGVQRFWTLNGDGYGTFGHIHMPANHHRLWGAFLLGSGSVTELSGWMLEDENREGVERVIRTARWAAAAAPVELPGYDFTASPPAPPSVWRRGGEKPLVAVTNWGDESLPYLVEAGRAGLYSGVRYAEATEILVPPMDGEAFIPYGVAV